MNIQDNFGRAPLHWACTCPTTECVEVMFKYTFILSLTV